MEKCFVIAEIAQGFEGDINLCRRFIDLAHKSGAHAVKFHIFKANELCTPDYEYYELFRKLEISQKDWESLIDYSVKKGIAFYADILGVETFSWFRNTKASAIKIHASDIKNTPFLKKVSDYRGRIILSTGGSEVPELEKALEIFKNNDVLLMSGFQAEPNLECDVELGKIAYLKKKFNRPVGYADHIDANSMMATVLPVLAYQAGASVIEKHLTIDRNNVQLEDYVSALNPDEFKTMMGLLAQVSQFNHSADYSLSPREQTYRKGTKKVPVAVGALKKGQVLTLDDAQFLRVKEKPTELLDIDAFLGKRLKKDLSPLEKITREVLE